MTGTGAGTTTRSAPGGRDRLLASGLDYLVIVAWVALLTVAMAAITALRPLDPAGWPLPAYDVFVFVLTVGPVGLYLALTEGGPHHASWGKRRRGLEVVTERGAPPGLARAAVRTVVKLLPWQLAHLATTRLILGIDAPALFWTADAAALALVALTLILAWRDPLHRALHDLVAGTRVVVRDPARSARR